MTVLKTSAPACKCTHPAGGHQRLGWRCVFCTCPGYEPEMPEACCHVSRETSRNRAEADERYSRAVHELLAASHDLGDNWDQAERHQLRRFVERLTKAARRVENEMPLPQAELDAYHDWVADLQDAADD